MTQKNNPQSLKPLALKGLVALLAAATPLSAADGDQDKNSTKNSANVQPADNPSDVKPVAVRKPSEKEPDPFEEMKKVDAASGNLNYHVMTEDELLLELDDDGTKMYNGLDSKGKELARFVASQRCQASNVCRGLAACETSDHSCAGKNSCKGTTKCGMSDKNLAVKLVKERLAEKRENSATK